MSVNTCSSREDFYILCWAVLAVIQHKISHLKKVMEKARWIGNHLSIGNVSVYRIEYPHKGINWLVAYYDIDPELIRGYTRSVTNNCSSEVVIRSLRLRYTTFNIYEAQYT